MNTDKYKVGDKVLLRVRPKRRVIFDDPYSENGMLESRPFTLVGGPNSSGLYVILIEDTSLASWIINDTHIRDHGIESKYKGKNGYGVYITAIGGIAPHLSYCKDCQVYNQALKLRSEKEIKLDPVSGQLACEYE